MLQRSDGCAWRFRADAFRAVLVCSCYVVYAYLPPLPPSIVRSLSLCADRLVALMGKDKPSLCYQSDLVLLLLFVLWNGCKQSLCSSYVAYHQYVIAEARYI